MGILGVEARQAAKHLIMQEGPPIAKNYLAPNINYFREFSFGSSL